MNREEEEGKQEEDGVGQLPAGVFKLEQQEKNISYNYTRACYKLETNCTQAAGI